MLRIRLSRYGKKDRPTWRVIVVESARTGRGKVVDYIGRYNPMAKPKEFVLDVEKYDQWVKNGAQPTDAIVRLKGRMIDKSPEYKALVKEKIYVNEEKEAAKKAEAEAAAKAAEEAAVDSTPSADSGQDDSPQAAEEGTEAEAAPEVVAEAPAEEAAPAEAAPEEPAPEPVENAEEVDSTPSTESGQDDSPQENEEVAA